MFARQFAEKYHGEIVGVIYGNRKIKSGRSHAGYKVKFKSFANEKEYIVHAYYFKTWHRNRDGISVSTEQLDEAIDEHALMLMNYNGTTEYVLHSTIWEKFAKEDGNYDTHSEFGTKEVFCRRNYFSVLDLFNHDWEDYYPNL